MKRFLSLGLIVCAALAAGCTAKGRAEREVARRGYKADQPVELADALTVKVPRGFILKGGATPQFPGDKPHTQFFLRLGDYDDFNGPKNFGTITVRAFPPVRDNGLALFYPLNPMKGPNDGYWQTVRTFSPLRHVYKRIGTAPDLRFFAAVDTERYFAVEMAVKRDLYTEEQIINIVDAAIRSIEIKQPAYDRLMAKATAEYEEAVRAKEKNTADLETRVGKLAADYGEPTVTAKGDVVGKATEGGDLEVAIRLGQIPAADPEAEAKRYQLDETAWKKLTTELPNAPDKRPGDDVLAVACFRNKRGELNAVRLEPGNDTHYVYTDAWGKAFGKAVLAGTPEGAVVFWRYRIVNLKRKPETFAAWITDSDKYRTAARDGAPIWKMKAAGK
jgi:hypothetical protein